MTLITSVSFASKELSCLMILIMFQKMHLLNSILELEASVLALFVIVGITSNFSAIFKNKVKVNSNSKIKWTDDKILTYFASTFHDFYTELRVE